MINFRQQIIQGVGWSAFASGFRQLIRFISSIALARLLLPNDFGLVAIALTITNVLWTFGEFGLWQALMRWEENIALVTDITFILNLVSSSILTLILLFAAPLIALTFFQDPALIPIIRILSLTLILNALERVPACLLDKSFNFKIRTQIEAVAQIIYLVVAISLAWLGFGVWALVGGVFVQLLFRVTLTLRVSSFKIRWRFDWRIAKSLLLFGQPLVYTSVLVSLSQNLDQLLVARFVGLAEVGFYTVSFGLSRIIMELPKQAIARVMLPGYSALQSDLEKMATLYLKSVQISCLFVFVISAGLAAIAKLAIPLLYTDLWIGMIPYIYIWTIRVMIVVTYFLTGHILIAVKKQRTLPWINALQLGIVIIASIILGRPFGGLGIAAASTLAALISAFIHQRITLSALNISSFTFIGTLMKPLIIALGMGVVTVPLVSLVPSTFFGLGLTILAGFVIAVLLSALFLGVEIRSNLKLFWASLQHGKSG